jgi:formylglycine-generating enzyme required for sulfatase activity
MRIPRRFALGRAPVTFEEYDLFCDATGRERPGDGSWGRERRPVIDVSWHDVNTYAAWLNARLGVEAYGLPSEAQWECGAGSPTRYWWGDDWDPARANGSASFEGGRTSPVGAYPPNDFGLHDTTGNVWEWCADGWTNDLSNVPDNGRPYKPLVRRSRKQQNNDAY